MVNGATDQQGWLLREYDEGPDRFIEAEDLLWPSGIKLTISLRIPRAVGIVPKDVPIRTLRRLIRSLIRACYGVDRSWASTWLSVEPAGSSSALDSSDLSTGNVGHWPLSARSVLAGGFSAFDNTDEEERGERTGTSPGPPSTERT